MPWNTGVFTQTNGVFTGNGIWAADAAAGTKITAAHHDTHDYDMAQGINQCVNKDGSNTVTILNLSATVNATSGIIKVGTLVLASTYGTQNAFFGGAGNFTMTGITNTGVGYSSLSASTTGNSNTAIGANALFAATSGSTNTALGFAALASNTTGNNNTGTGSQALNTLTTGLRNTAVGYQSAINLTTGNSNTAIGGNSLNTVTTGSNNVVIGFDADVPSATDSGQMSIANAIYGTGNTGTLETISSGNIGFFIKAPTARLHLPAVTATAGTASLKIDAGTVLGTPETGAFEFDGTHLYFTVGGVRKTVTLT